MADLEPAVSSGTNGQQGSGQGAKDLGVGLATAAVVGVGVALIEVAWVPGILIGVAAMAFPRFLPSVGKNFKPMLRSAIKTGYSASQKTREWVAEAGEQVSDMMAEVRAAAVEPIPSNGVPHVPAAGAAASEAVVTEHASSSEMPS